MIKLLTFDGLGQICAISTVEDSLAESYVARDPRWSKIAIKHEDERTIAGGGGLNMHFAVIAGDQSAPKKDPPLQGWTLDREWNIHIHRKAVLPVTIENDVTANCDCGAQAHALSPTINLEGEETAPGTTITLRWSCSEPLRLWLNSEPFAGPEGGFCRNSVDFTPPMSGRMRIWATHPRFHLETVIVHAVDPESPLGAEIATAVPIVR
jgi:hypothetical protein